MMNQLNRYSRCNRKSRLLVPIRNSSCIDGFMIWLQQNPQFMNSHVKFVHVMRPLWFDDIPYSSMHALRLISEQYGCNAERQREFTALARRAQKKHPGLFVSVSVTAGHLDGNTFADMARDWHAEAILIIRKKQSSVRRLFFGNKLAEKIMKVADCPVFVFNVPNDGLMPSGRALPLADQERI